MCTSVRWAYITLFEIYGMHSDAEFVNTLNDEIRKRGAMDTLTNDRAQAEISKRVQDIRCVHICH